MAQDMQWPSEDEDFDAVTTPEASRRRRSRSAPAEQAPAPAPTPVERPAVAPRAAAPARTVTVTEAPAPQPAPQVDPVEAAFADNDAEEDDFVFEEDQHEHTPQQQRQPEPVAAVAPVEARDEPTPEPAKPQKAPKAPKPPKEPRQPGRHTNAFRTVFELALVVALIGVGYFAYTLTQDKAQLNSKITTLSNDPQIAVQKQTDKLISDVGSLMSLPQGEVPTVASVSDAAKAKQQSNFFNNAQDGDKVLMYVKAGQAVLYRPSTNKIVLVAPLTFNSAATATPAATTKATR